MRLPLFRGLVLPACVAGFLLSAAAARCQISYQLDPAASRIYIKVDSATLLGHPHGVQGNLASGKLSFEGAGELVFDMASFSADTAEARRYVGLSGQVSAADARKVTENMQGGDVLDVARFPRAVYAITSVRPLRGQKAGEPGPYLLEGRFTLHGVTQPLRLTVVVEPAERRGELRVHGSFMLLQTAYGIQPYAALGGLARVADQLEIWGELKFSPTAR
jgi:polyisoprenoid-binding protein YceI